MTSLNVVQFPRDKTPDEVLQQHVGEFHSVLVIGLSENGMVISSTGPELRNLAQSNWILDQAKLSLIG